MSEIPTKEKLDKYEPWLDRFDGEEARLLKGLFLAARELHRIRQSPGLAEEQRALLESFEPDQDSYEAAAAALALIDSQAAALARVSTLADAAWELLNEERGRLIDEELDSGGLEMDAIAKDRLDKLNAIADLRVETHAPRHIAPEVENRCVELLEEKLAERDAEIKRLKHQLYNERTRNGVVAQQVEQRDIKIHKLETELSQARAGGG